MVSIPTSGEKALSFAGKILPPAAGTLAFLADPMQHYQKYGWDSTITEFKDRILLWSFPDLGALWHTASTWDVYRNNIIGGGIVAIVTPIIQKFLREMGFGLPKTVNNVLGVVKRTAAGAFSGGVAGALIWLPGALNKWAGAKAPAMSVAASSGQTWLY